MLRRRFAMAGALALALVLASAGSGRAQMIGSFGTMWPGMGAGMYSPYGMGMNYMGMGYGGPSSMALVPLRYIAFYPPLYTSRAPVVAPAWPLLPVNQAATVTVLVPPDAVVLFDGQQTSQGGPQRVFSTPPLEKGQSYHYMVEARFMHNGQLVQQAQRVQVHSGGEAAVVFPVSK